MDNGQWTKISNFKFQISNGFTMVELLVVIAIMAITGIFVFSNYKSFGEDRNLKNAVLDIQSLLRQAQTNSTTGLKCQGNDNKGWFIYFYIYWSLLQLRCVDSNGAVSLPFKNVSFPAGISIFSINPQSIPVCNIYAVSFAPLFGTATSFCNSPANSINSFPLTITLRNNKISPDCTGANLAKCKQLTIEQGGRIYGQ